MHEAAGAVLRDRPAASAELTITWEEVCRYLDSLAVRGRRHETIQVYRPKLEAFYRFLPEDKRITADTLELWRAASCGKAIPPALPTPMCPPSTGCWPIWGGGICS